MLRHQVYMAGGVAGISTKLLGDVRLADNAIKQFWGMQQSNQNVDSRPRVLTASAIQRV